MSPLIILFLLSVAVPALARDRHVIRLSSSSSTVNRFTSLSYDPSSQHFLVGGSSSSVISSVSDAGTIQTLTDASTFGSVSSVAVDYIRRRLISAGSASSNIVSSYDLRSPIPHRLIFSSPISVSSDSAVATVDVSAGTGDAYIATASGEIFKSDLFGNLSNLAHAGKGITGMSFVNNGYLLVVGPTGMFKVDAEDGVVKQVLTSSELNMEKVRMRKDGAVVTGGKTARWLKSQDGWAQMSVYDEFSVSERERIVDVAVRDRSSVYILVEKEEEDGNRSSRIEEVEWGREGEGEMVWVLVLVGLALAYFTYWRLQMRKLVENVNKKRT